MCFATAAAVATAAVVLLTGTTENFDDAAEAAGHRARCASWRQKFFAAGHQRWNFATHCGIERFLQYVPLREKEREREWLRHSNSIGS